MKSSELNQLNCFIGTWHAEGTSFGEIQDVNNPKDNGVKWVSDETYQWLPGNCFVIHNWHAKTGNSVFIGTEIIGYDEKTGKFYTYFFDNNGNHPIYTATVRGNEWNFFEENTRATITVEDQDTIIYNWEWKHDGSDWLPLCNRIAKRVK